MKFVVACVKQGWCFPLTTRPNFPYCFQDMDTKFKCSTAIDEIFKSLGRNQLKMVIVDEVSMLSTQFLVLLDTRL
jgi:hypothetical protein